MPMIVNTAVAATAPNTTRRIGSRAQVSQPPVSPLEWPWLWPAPIRPNPSPEEHKWKLQPRNTPATPYRGRTRDNVPVKFCVQLSCDYPDTSYGADQVYGDMLEQALLADRSGFESVAFTEHHLINCLMNPSPLMFAIKVATMTKNLKVMTAVVVLPLHDMRILAGEIVVADTLTDGRLMLGVGRGAFEYEMERLGVPMSETKDRFDESLNVLLALLREEEVSWDGEFYQFDPLTIMPRPVGPERPPIMMAVMNPPGIRACVKRGFHIMTTPLSGDAQLFRSQVDAFTESRAEMGDAGEHLTLSLSRVAYVTTSDTHKREIQQRAHHYYGRFDNVFTGPGLVDNGRIRELPHGQSVEQLAESLLIGSTEELVDQLGVYADAGVDRMILNINFGIEQAQTLETIQALAEEVLPQFAADPVGATNG
jgi:alkanesulfonate monooxygenase SsuD/methylene tetrahydromethanopterin reductase-like flavin-dependent oxidoreductase (luciferase family)